MLFQRGSEPKWCLVFRHGVSEKQIISAIPTFCFHFLFLTHSICSTLLHKTAPLPLLLRSSPSHNRTCMLVLVEMKQKQIFLTKGCGLESMLSIWEFTANSFHQNIFQRFCFCGIELIVPWSFTTKDSYPPYLIKKRLNNPI